MSMTQLTQRYIPGTLQVLIGFRFEPTGSIFCPAINGIKSYLRETYIQQNQESLLLKFLIEFAEETGDTALQDLKKNICLYRICPNRSPVCDRKGLGARLLISTIKSVIRHLKYAYIYTVYGKQELRGPLFTRKWRFAHVWQPNRPEYHLNFSVFWTIF